MNFRKVRIRLITCKDMKISNIVFTDSEEAELRRMATRNLGRAPDDLSQANLVRAALGFEIRQQGGARSGTGPKPKKRVAKRSRS